MILHCYLTVFLVTTCWFIYTRTNEFVCWFWESQYSKCVFSHTDDELGKTDISPGNFQDSFQVCEQVHTYRHMPSWLAGYTNNHLQFHRVCVSVWRWILVFARCFDCRMIFLYTSTVFPPTLSPLVWCFPTIPQWTTHTLEHRHTHTSHLYLAVYSPVWCLSPPWNQSSRRLFSIKSEYFLTRPMISHFNDVEYIYTFSFVLFCSENI